MDGSYPSRFEHPATLDLTTGDASEGGGRGMVHATAETTPLSGRSVLVPGMESPMTEYPNDNRSSQMVVAAAPLVRQNNSRYQFSRHFSFPGMREGEKTTFRQTSAPAVAVSPDDNRR